MTRTRTAARTTVGGRQDPGRWFIGPSGRRATAPVAGGVIPGWR